MFKSLLIMCALVAPVLSQEAPEASPAPGAPPHHKKAHRPAPARMMLMHDLVLQKYDADKDGKLSDGEKAALKADADKIRDARKQERLAKWDKDGDGKLSDEEKAAMKADREANAPEGKGPKGEGKHPRKPGKHGAHAPLPGMREIGHQLLMEKYDADKDGKLSESERAAVKADADALRKAKKHDCPEGDVPPPADGPEGDE